MLEVAAACYGVIASFVVASASRNRREQRDHSAVLTLFAWLLLSFSAVLGVLLLGWAGLAGAGLAAA